MAKQSKQLPSAVPIAMDLQWGGWSLGAIAAGLELDVFSAVASGKTTAPEVARAAGADSRAMQRLLDALVSLKYLTRKGERYALTPATTTFLVRGSDLYMEGAGRMAQGQLMGWFQLAEVIRSGKPMEMPGGEAAMAGFFSMLVKAIFPPNFVAAKAAAATMTKGERARIKNILDVAAGAAAWSIPFAQAIPAARVTVADFPQVTPVAREYTARFGVGDRYDYLEGNLRDIDFGTSRFDLVILGHIIHGEGREGGRRLIERAHAALRDGGMLLIGEFVPNDDRTGPPIAMLFDLNMLLHTPEGGAFTMKEYREWLKAAGFKTIKTIRTPAAPSPLILARK